MERDDVSGSIGSMAIGKYQVFASLGRGGMADVFLAVARGPMGFNKLTVIKRLRSDHAADPSFATMLLEEARLAARLSHPNVVHTYEVGEEKGAYFIAMEYLDGQPLVRVARTSAKASDRLVAPLCARIIADALSGLHYAHELRDYDGTSLKIIHRDVSPHNIFVTYDGVVKLMDFGIAKATSSATQTEAGVLKGKIAYMSPEQVMGETVDRRADIFAMGIVLWELLTGERLFSSTGAAATLHKLLTQPIPRVSSKVPDVDPGLDEAVAKALAKDPDKRFQTAQEMRNALEEYVSRSGAAPRQEDIGRHVSQLFEETRQNTNRQVQIHMAQVSLATSTGELVALNADALKRSVSEPTPSGRNLLSLESRRDSGSGSDVGAASPPSLSEETAPKKKMVAAPVIGAFVIALILAGVALAKLRAQPQAPPSPVATAAPPPVESEPPPAPAPTPDPQPPPATPVVASPSPSPSPSPATLTPPATPTHHDHSHATAPAPHPAPAPSAVADVGTGYLTLDTYPWTRVSENGRALGVTPIVHVALSAGTHVLTLENADQGIKQSYPVTLKADETVSRRLGLK